MRNRIGNFVKRFVAEYPHQKGTHTRWKEPLIACAEAGDELFAQLKEVVSPTHALPGDFLPGARTVIAYFLPFEDTVPESNIAGFASSKTWAVAYIETNKLILDLNTELHRFLGESDYRSAILPATHNFEPDKLISNWSHRHAAYIAGLGKFGLNNMLITARGCCGRVGTLVTDLLLEPTPREEREYCLYKLKQKCARCAARCVNGALAADRYDRRKCYEMCRHNAALYPEIGLADVCGKCLVGLPCSTSIPGDRR